MAEDLRKNIKLTIEIPDENIFIIRKVLASNLDAVEAVEEQLTGKIPIEILDEQKMVREILQKLIDEVDKYVRK